MCYDYFPVPLLNLSPTPIQSLSPYIHDCFHGPIVEPGPFVLPLDWGYPMEHDVTSGSMLKAFSCPWIYCEGSSGVLALASDPLLDPAPLLMDPFSCRPSGRVCSCRELVIAVVALYPEDDISQSFSVSPDSQLSSTSLAFLPES